MLYIQETANKIKFDVKYFKFVNNNFKPLSCADTNEFLLSRLWISNTSLISIKDHQLNFINWLMESLVATKIPNMYQKKKEASYVNFEMKAKNNIV